jgi:outer membrane protein assembly factor BamB
VNSKVFVGTASGEVYALSEKTGDVLRKVELGESISFQPTVANGRIYVGTDRGSLFCLLTGDSADDGWVHGGRQCRPQRLGCALILVVLGTLTAPRS